MASPYAITPTDRSGAIVISATLFMTWMVLVCLIRIYMRLAINGPPGMDDVAAWVGGTIGIVQVGMVMDGVSHGLGKSHPGDLASMMKDLYVADILFLAGHCAAKLSVVLLLKRLGRHRVYLRLCVLQLGAIVLWAAVSTLAVALRCDPTHPWQLNNCGFFVSGWRAITAFDVITEAFLLGLSIHLVWGIQMRRSQKAAVIFAFGIRVLIVLLVVLRQVYLNHISVDDTFLDLSNALVVTEVLLHCSLMAATVPCLKPFVIAFNTGWGQGSHNKGSRYLRTGTSGGARSVSQSQSHLKSADDEITMIPTDEDIHGNEAANGHGPMLIHETLEWNLRTEYIEMADL
ncbi:hypothetical protein BO70DRAFT_300147 [Aspergillus heteromorphus CBS 117.55]|uniref:Rhodopsin domain-containing protein n=1 Tax=Aspergillus heteromorphus CBS 117.55 TaxID=1448321 RepID=A0A317V4Y4_9EURO|nr:uncharacterized protein BO70DRAFT_300147 [Aspergillus heteromorphus CBS 117.55]PWY69046.1 hypothetical protein BO70DRAFT_300147 [Aspergillus heteromorphus CBS 117.55]